jgi:hypothetical protein
MTFEKRCTVEPNDVLAAHFECAKCGTSFRVPIDKLGAFDVHRIALSSCRGCHEPTGFADGTSELIAFEAFIGALAALRPMVKGRNLRLKMEVKCAE